MGSVREHLATFHARAGAHSLARAKFHRAMGAHFQKLAALSKTAKSEMQDDGDAGAMDLFDSAAAEHNQMADECADLGQFHCDCAKSLTGDESATQKAMGMGSERTAALVPDSVSGIAPPEPPSNIRAIPRHGAPQLERSTVAPGLEKFVSVEDDVIH